MKVQDPDFLSWLFIPCRIFIKNANNSRVLCERDYSHLLTKEAIE